MNTNPNVKIWVSYMTKTIEVNIRQTRGEGVYSYPELCIRNNWSKYKQDDSLIVSDAILKDLMSSSDYVEVGDFSYIIDEVRNRYTNNGQKEENIYIKVRKTNQDESVVIDSKYAGMMCRMANGEVQKTLQEFYESKTNQMEKEFKIQKSYDRLEEEMKELKKYNKILLTLMWGIPSVFALLIIFKNLLPLK